MPKTHWQEKGVGVSLRRGQSKRKQVTDERDGSVAGVEIEHWDDHQDAIVMPKPIVVKAKTEVGEWSE